ncbi:2-oxo acid dehydrogenase subunit E2 [candidate division KSB1 bacterium]|nr:2-oxo acid dehydrogenase subunit E2 [candidate division KSB1 bacterium]NIR72879.1 2-oxo acid dehydrogenase subunit E2 [candidate division KSB1 bacterium]NIS25156.1 2-oxo acid dehydrogenase subunit E2 [candidate division KSB1 bacterium]NIT72067.1 2-oxo acid dehydrogenase subunit E2 [candidate division KSB1 bacterium]NIU25858.1 2-oxo acid dehydrogenase subunit E2 [candidate division KSB1 bacterium]
MAKVDVTMPQMGESVAEGTIVKWLKKEGETVEQDEIILEISTDKVDSEIPSPHAGVLKKILTPEGETVEVGSKIAEIETDGDGEVAAKPEEEAEEKKAEEEKQKKEEEEAEDKEREVAEAKEEEKAEKKEPEKERKEEPKEEEVEAKKPEEPEQAKPEQKEVPRTDRTGRKFYSPLVRSIARAENISEQELEQIEGTGSNGRVTKNDILAYIKERSEKAPEVTERPPAYTPPAQPEFSDERVEVIPMDTMRKSIAKHMVQSVQTSPHVFALSEADMTNLVKYRQQHKEEFLDKVGVKLTYMPFIIHACTKALLDFPLVNSSVDGEKIVRKKYINVGMAVALENNGLIVPVIKDADGLNVVGLARAATDLAQRARSKKLKPDEVQGGTFSITNMGTFGSILGFPIIHQPQVAILGVGIIQKRPVVRNDAIAIRDMMYISLSFDHRIVDGALAGQFLDRIAHYLTNFDTDKIL